MTTRGEPGRDRREWRRMAIGAAVALPLLLGGGEPQAQTRASEYTIAELLEPCVEGDNDSRWGAAAEAECEQYIRGFTDALVVTDALKSRGICLPAENRLDEVRWAFVRWAHEHFESRHKPAAEGLLETLKARFAC